MGRPTSRVSRVVVTGPLGGVAKDYEVGLKERGYTRRSAVSLLRQVARLSRWLGANGLTAADLSSQRVEEFLAFQRCTGESRSQWSRPGLVCLLGVLFVRAAERWGQVSRMERPAGWVYRVAVNWATSWRRKWSRRPTLPVEVLDRPHHDDLGTATLLEELAGLPLAQRQMLVLRFVLGYSVPETAAALNVAEGTVKSGVHRARQQPRADAEVSDDTR